MRSPPCRHVQAAATRHDGIGTGREHGLAKARIEDPERHREHRNGGADEHFFTHERHARQTHRRAGGAVAFMMKAEGIGYTLFR